VLHENTDLIKKNKKLEAEKKFFFEQFNKAKSKIQELLQTHKLYNEIKSEYEE